MTSPHQATCVAIERRALLIEGPPGSGKSSLALALLDRGAVLVGDDGVLLDPRYGVLHVRPHPETRGLIEVRNVGLIGRPAIDAAPAALVVVLDREAPRYVEQAESCERAGVALPLIRLWPDSPVLALRAEAALARYGLGAG